MSKPIVLSVVGIVVGIVVGMVVMMSLHMASTLVYPPPEGVSFMSQEPENQERLREWFGTLPTGAFLLAAACHGLGCMAGAAIATVIAGRRSLWPAVIVGIFFTACGIMNLRAIPHPSWFPFVDLSVYLTLAVVAGLLLFKEPDDEEAAAASA